MRSAGEIERERQRSNEQQRDETEHKDERQARTGEELGGRKRQEEPYGSKKGRVGTLGKRDRGWGELEEIDIP